MHVSGFSSRIGSQLVTQIWFEKKNHSGHGPQIKKKKKKGLKNFRKEKFSIKTFDLDDWMKKKFFLAVPESDRKTENNTIFKRKGEL